MPKRIITILLLLITLLPIKAATSVSVIPPTRVAKGDKFAVTIRVNDARLDVEPSAPDIPGCKFLIGPSLSMSQFSSYSGGQATSGSRADYTFYYRADDDGEKTIPAVSLNIGGKTIRTSPVKFTIARNQQEANNLKNRPVSVNDINTQTSDRPVSNNDLFVRIILSKSTAYEQEAIECTIKLYTKYGISEFLPTRQPSFDGFLIQEEDIMPTLNEDETYKGQLYKTAILKKCIIFPQKSGNLTINSGDYDVTVYQYDQVSMGYFVVNSPVEKKVQITSNSASIEIKPLPTPAPAGFNGAVGDFSVDCHLIGSTFRTGEASSLLYTVKGSGNIKYLKEPMIDFPTEFEKYTPKNEFEGGVAGPTVDGVLTYDFTFVPTSVGTFKIGVSDFVYFSPSTGTYKTITLPSYNVTVIQGVGNDGRSDIKSKNTDILHIKQGVEPSKPATLLVETVWFWAMFVILAAALATVMVIYGKRQRLAADVTGLRLAKADKVASSRLKKAHKFMSAGDADKFYAEILSALWGYIGDKLLLPAAKLTRDNISTELTEYGASQELITSIIEILDQCEMARYTPSVSAEQLTDVYKRTKEAINALERVRKHKGGTPTNPGSTMPLSSSSTDTVILH